MCVVVHGDDVKRCRDVRNQHGSVLHFDPELLLDRVVHVDAGLHVRVPALVVEVRQKRERGVVPLVKTQIRVPGPIVAVFHSRI